MNPSLEILHTTADVDLEIDPADEATARAYIEAILQHAQAESALSPEHVAAERRRLWGRFATRYVEVSTPPLARRGEDALRSALLNI